MARLLAGVVVLALWSLGVLAILLLVIVLLFRLGLWAIVLVLALAILSGNLPLAFLMVLVLGSALAGVLRD
jgi:hypothetical protein